MKQYFYVNSQGQQMPPVDFESLRNAGITPDTMVWYEGLPTWMRAADIPELKSIVGSVPPPTSYQSSIGQNPIQPGAYPPPQQQKPQTYLWLGICTTLLCCLPAGIVSIMYASKVDSYWGQGRYSDAINSSDKAKMWGIISAGVGLFASIIFFILAIAGI